MLSSFHEFYNEYYPGLSPTFSLVPNEDKELAHTADLKEIHMVWIGCQYRDVELAHLILYSLEESGPQRPIFV